MRAFGYVRISKLDEGTTSPARQREAISKLCSERAWTLVEMIEDLDLSAYKRGVKRPGFDRMMGRLGEVEAIVFWRIDRLSRSVADFSRILEACDAAGVKLVSTDQQIDTTSAIGKAFVQISSVFAELESGTLSERSRQMHAHLRAKGKHVGRVPFGWRTQEGFLVREPTEQGVLREMAQRYVAGQSMREVAQEFGFHHPNLARMLKSGRVIDAMPPSLSESLISALGERARTGSRAKRSLLGGIARCSVCVAGMTVVAERTRGDKVWSAYSCRERRHVSISRPWLDEYISAQVLEAIDTGKLIRRLEKKRPGNAPRTSEIEARLEMLETDFYERGIINRDSYLKRREALLKRLQTARTDEADAGIDLPRELAANLSERWPELSLVGRRRIIAAVMQRVDVARATGRGKIDASRVSLIWRG